MREEFEEVYESCAAWCRARDFAGHDPFDALNSRLFQSTPLRRSRLARLVWTQAFKRSPVNLRALARVPAERNAKGTALFALASLARLRARADAKTESETRALLDDLINSQIETEHGAAWGYNFDWQGRAFYAPKGTPTIVPTAFAVRALTEAWMLFDEGDADRNEYLTASRRACEFILRELNRSVETEDEICFSYTPLDGTRVFNASLLAGEALASVGELTGEPELIETALKTARYVVRRQRADGSWFYGEADYQSWADNFHTAFILTSLARIIKVCKRMGEKNSDAVGEMRSAIERGLQFWRAEFFLADGWPKYYHRSVYPADAHSAGAALVALAELREFDPLASELARRVARWAIHNLFDARGFFRYQRRRLYTVRTPYMRWSQGWMMYGLAKLVEGMRAEG